MTEEGDFGVVSIVGVGLIGGSIGQALHRRRLASKIIGVGRDATRLEEARALSAIDEWSTDLADACRRSDIVILCTPVEKIIEDLPTVLASCGPGSLITDAGSVKGVIVAAAGEDPRFLGGHPMAGSERTGVVAARPELFEEATWAITPTPNTPPETVDRLRNLAQAIGARTLIISPHEHDQVVAVTSHLPHMLATSLMRLAAERSCEISALPQMTAGSFADATRVAASSPSLWRDILLQNRDAILTSARSYQQLLNEFIAALDAGDAGTIERFFAEGAEAKRNWPR